MRSKALISSLALVVFASAGCKRHGQVASVGGEKIDACQLLTPEEVQAVQGSPILDTKSSEQSDAGLRVSQCFYATEESNRSVSLVLTQSDPDSRVKRNPKDYWYEVFGRGQEKGTKESTDKEEERQSQEISGVGDAACWVGSSVARALYVLKQDVFIRISIGGPDDEKGKLDKSKALAEKAFQRLGQQK